MYIYIYIYKQDLALNNPQELICHKTPTNHLFKDITPTLITKNNNLSLST